MINGQHITAAQKKALDDAARAQTSALEVAAKAQVALAQRKRVVKE